MRTLRTITPTPEQLRILSRTTPGAEIIRGAAGSGKTTTALLRLKSLIGFFTNRKRRENDPSPVRILVLTYREDFAVGIRFGNAHYKWVDGAGAVVKRAKARAIVGNPPWAAGRAGNPPGIDEIGISNRGYTRCVGTRFT
jgi:hypothetical protein